MKRISAILLALLLTVGLAPLSALAGGPEPVSVSTEVKLEYGGLDVTGVTEDCVLGIGDDQTLSVSAAGPAPLSFLWQLSTDGGATWTAPPGAGDSASYLIESAQPNSPAVQPYLYRVTVTDASGFWTSATVRVLVSDDYSYQKISLRNGDTDISAYMRSQTRLVVTPLGDSPAATVLEGELPDGCLPLMLYDVSLVNESNEAVPYFGAVQVDFHVGGAYDGQTLSAYHYSGGSTTVYSGVVGATASGILSITVDSLSPFMVGVPAENTRTVTASAGAGGSVSPAGNVNVPDGGSKTFTFLPDAGYAVSEVRLDNAAVSFSGNSCTLANITGNHSLDVSFTQVPPSDTVHTVTVGNGAHGSVYPSGNVQVYHGKAQTVYIYPNSGYELDKLLVNGGEVSVIGSSYTLSAVTADTNVQASFREATTQPPNVYKTIAASSGENGSISPAGDSRVEYGGGLYYYFIPNDGYEVDQVLVDGSAVTVSGNSYHFVNVVADRTVSVSFAEIETPPPASHTITASSGANGSISPSGANQVAEGGSQTFSFLPGDGYEIDTVTVDGTAISVAGSAYTFSNVTQDHSIRVTYKQTVSPTTYYTVLASSGINGSISPAGSVRIAGGGSQTFVFTPASDYLVDVVKVDGAAVTVAGSSYRFDNITRDHSISVSFKRGFTPADASQPQPQPRTTYHTITASAGSHGSISPTGSISVAAGGSQTLWFLPDEGYEVNTVTVDGRELSDPGGSYSFSRVTAGHRISVSFKPIGDPGSGEYHTIKADCGEHGEISPIGELKVASGQNAYFYFIPDKGYEIDTLTVDGKEAEAKDGSYTFEAVDADHTISLSFREKASLPAAEYHSISISVEGRGSVSPSGEIKVPEGGAQVFQLIPEDGYEVEAVYLGGVAQKLVGSQFTVDNVTENLALKVCFRSAGSGRDSGLLRYWFVPLILLAAGAVLVIVRQRRRS